MYVFLTFVSVLLYYHYHYTHLNHESQERSKPCPIPKKTMPSSSSSSWDVFNAARFKREPQGHLGGTGNSISWPSDLQSTGTSVHYAGSANYPRESSMYLWLLFPGNKQNQFNCAQLHLHIYLHMWSHMAGMNMSQDPGTVLNPKIAGKWMFFPP
jgi:hypothetical protein